jgi:ketosteroid isomerase-like protein
MKQRISILIATVLLTSSFAFAQSINKDETTFRSLITQLTYAQTSYDAKALDRIFTPDYIEISPAGEFDTRDKVLGFYSPEAKSAATGMSASVVATDFSIRRYGKFAIVITRLTYEMSSAGKSLPPRSIRASYVMRKDGNEWKIASAQYTGIRPAPAAKPQ